jgi:thiosulfate/3-mercaptopyruvate sulfurtransferase
VDAYEKGHIPNAVSIDWENELHDQPRREFISSERLAELLGSKGISSEQTIVLYSGNNNWFAAYAYWLFRYRGVEDVKLLNGGRKKWELESRLLTQDVPARPPATFEVGAERPELRVLRDEVLELVRRDEGAWVDVRSPEEFRGELLAPPHLPQEQAQVPGHIPGARNITWSKTVADDGSFFIFGGDMTRTLDIWRFNPDGEVATDGGTWLDAERAAGLQPTTPAAGGYAPFCLLPPGD